MKSIISTNTKILHRPYKNYHAKINTIYLSKQFYLPHFIKQRKDTEYNGPQQLTLYQRGAVSIACFYQLFPRYSDYFEGNKMERDISVFLNVAINLYILRISISGNVHFAQHRKYPVLPRYS